MSEQLIIKPDIKRKSILEYIHVNHNGDRFIDPVDLINSQEGYSSFVRDRQAGKKKKSFKKIVK